MLDHFWFPRPDDDYDPAWWAVIEAVAKTTMQDDRLASIHPGEFMMMGREDRPDRPRIWLYKHIWTRRYLNLDDACQAYMYVSYPRDDRYVGYYPAAPPARPSS